MKYRVLSLFLAVAALMVLMNVPVEGQDKDKNTHVGKLLSVKGKTFSMDVKGVKHDHVLALKGEVLDVDGKECKLSDLKKNQLIRVTTSEGDAKVATKVEAIKKKGVIVIGVKNDYKPWGFLTPAGEIVGLEIDMSDEIAKKIGVKLEKIPVTAANRIEFLQQGRIDTGLLTENCRFYFSKETVGDFASSLRPLGAIQSVAIDGESLRGGMTFRSFKVAFANKGVRLTTFTTADGKIEQFLVEPAS